ncbi:carboxypeptidase-like regulatory domain-containing protein [Phytohabitans houttuyneae]|uniref:Uncharacterized protein n=1 Tax=Phytohabitans houttuyneae TaxID=1076126 RepID=A0A6V8KQP2_9ACTN|nr:carboxypeptidase-like regulatory domain-containing protein [Phytohabitans houttuyneae]GFJ84186.1 hypothetical protein Phou_083660 [Phytohabitans houttuyneae]
MRPLVTLIDQWLGGAESEAATRPVQVVAGQSVTLDERQLPTGMVRGRLTDRAGQPPVASGVVIEDAARGRQFPATTAADGTWFKMVWPGTYTVRYESGGQVQWATGRSSAATADPVRVAAGGTTQLDEVLLPTGSLTVRAAGGRGAWRSRPGRRLDAATAGGTGRRTRLVQSSREISSRC